MLVTTIGQQAQEYEFVEAVSPASLTPFVWFGWFLVVVFLISALTGWDLKFEGPNGELVDEPYKGRLAE